MARRAMRGHSRILHETVTEKLEAATAPTAPMAQEKGGGEKRDVFEGKLYVGARKCERERSGSGTRRERRKDIDFSR